MSKLVLEVFSSFGPPKSILSDNGTVFRSRELVELCKYWEVKQENSCAYRPKGNGIVERVHRSIKRTVGRTNKSVEEAVFWHNNSASPSNLVPFEVIFGVKSKKPGISKDRRPVTRSVVETPTEIDGKSFSYKNPFLVNDKVYLRTKQEDVTFHGVDLTL